MDMKEVIGILLTILVIYRLGEHNGRIKERKDRWI